ncbi:phosphate-starvation-inducible PsiE family protein [Nakamurella deserti]|uniref:phosphate-starvation-inducible PsiE family protein n=1 Tax=Nakamurella deserti TaxID=2164074 RepID=UPI001F0C46BE|nr:phosphate-starvation-inducible PsiE family protein [Nakamurella deserti]
MAHSAGGQRRDTSDDPRPHPPLIVRIGNRTLEIAEMVVYVGIAVFLVVTALSLLVQAARQVLPLFGPEGVSGQLAIDILDILLLVFIVVELLFAVRITITRRELIAEPFLLVGIIASIKEIVVLSVKAADEIGKGPTFSDSMWEIGVLGVLVVVLGTTALLLRRKEREPVEGNEDTEDDPYEEGL